MIATEMCNFKASSVGNHYRTQNLSQQPFNSDSASFYFIFFLIYNQYFALGYDEGPMWSKGLCTIYFQTLAAYFYYVLLRRSQWPDLLSNSESLLRRCANCRSYRVRATAGCIHLTMALTPQKNFKCNDLLFCIWEQFLFHKFGYFYGLFKGLAFYSLVHGLLG